MKREAVHRRRHAVLADAVVDVASAVLSGRDVDEVLRLGVVGGREIGRAEDEFGHRHGQDVEGDLARLSRRDRLRLGDEALLELGDDVGKSLRAKARNATLEFEAVWSLCQTLGPFAPHPAAAAAGSLSKRRGCLPEPRTAHRASRARPWRRQAPPRRAASRAPSTCRPSWARQSRWWSCTRSSSGGRDFFARAMARLIACGSWPSMRVARQPAASKRFTWSTESESDSGPSMEMPLSSKSTIRRFSLRCPASANASVAEALHEVAIGGEDVGVMVDERVAELGVEHPLGESHADRRRNALAERAGRRLDAGGHEVFGMPRSLRFELAEALQFLDRHALGADEVEEGVEQHRAVSAQSTKRSRSGQARSAASYLRCFVNRTVATSAAPMGSPGCPAFAFSTASIASARTAFARSE